MAKKKNNSKVQRQNFTGNTARGENVRAAQAKAAPVQEIKPVTMEDVSSSKSQAEFEANKEKLIRQLMDEVQKWEDDKAEAEKAAGEERLALEKLEGEKALLASERDKIQADYDNAMQKIINADDEAKAVRANADKYAEETCRNADRISLKTINDAHDEARSAWQEQINDLKKKADEFRRRETALEEEIASREAALHEERKKLSKERLDVEYEKEYLEELKEDYESRKTRYDAANPAKIDALNTELKDERDRYAALMKQYDEQKKELLDLQVMMDTLKTEIEDPENGTRMVSMDRVVSNLRELRREYDRLASVCAEYPDKAAIERLENKARMTEMLEQENRELELELNKYKVEFIAHKNAVKDLEIVKREVEATNTLNQHLLHELESHKTALESRTGDTCPSLSRIDMETETEQFKGDIDERTRREGIKTLSGLVSHVKNYAGSRRPEERLYYTDNDIRAFLAGMAVSRLIILEGMSGTGKSSLPRIFSEAASGFSRLIPVESSWRDRNELLGYYNDFNKKFNAKSFTIELYRSSRECCRQIPTFIVLDEMNLARIEYYFSDFLAILQEPDHDKWLIELVSSDMRTLPVELPESIKDKMRREEPMIYSVWEKIERGRQGDLTAETSDEDKAALTSWLEKLGQLTGAKDLIDGRKIKVTDNIWFVGTANRDESTFAISDKVYDRAQVVSLNRKGRPEGKYTYVNAKFISVEMLEALFRDAIADNKYKKEVEERLDALDAVLMEKFDVSFGNRIVAQTVDFVGVFTAAEGKLNDALDYQISTKILRKVIDSDDEEALLALLDAVKDYPESRKQLEKRIKELN